MRTNIQPTSWETLLYSKTVARRVSEWSLKMLTKQSAIHTLTPREWRWPFTWLDCLTDDGLQLPPSWTDWSEKHKTRVCSSSALTSKISTWFWNLSCYKKKKDMLGRCTIHMQMTVAIFLTQHSMSKHAGGILTFISIRRCLKLNKEK